MLEGGSEGVTTLILNLRPKIEMDGRHRAYRSFCLQGKKRSRSQMSTGFGGPQNGAELLE
jgi:hypothetical protein